MSFKERSALLMAGSLVLVYGAYFCVVVRWLQVAPASEVAYQPLLIVATIPLVILAVVGHAVLALFSWGELREAAVDDERDRLITIRSERIGGLVLSLGIAGGLVLAMFSVEHFFIANALLLIWVLAEIAEASTRVVLYRRGT